jgi:hypothetical protein
LAIFKFARDIFIIFNKGEKMYWILTQNHLRYRPTHLKSTHIIPKELFGPALKLIASNASEEEINKVILNWEELTKLKSFASPYLMNLLLTDGFEKVKAEIQKEFCCCEEDIVLNENTNSITVTLTPCLPASKYFKELFKRVFNIKVTIRKTGFDYSRRANCHEYTIF